MTPVKMSHLLGGIAGGVAFGLVAGLLLGSCVFPGGPNRASVSGVGTTVGAMAAAPPATPGGMDPGAGIMDGIFAEIDRLKQAVERNPRDRASLVALGNLFYDSNKFDEAIGYYDRALRLDREDPNVLTDMGNAYWLSGDVGTALEIYRETQQKYPDHWQSAAGLFFLSAGRKDAQTAAQALARVKRSNPGFEKIPEMERILAEISAGGAG